MFKKSYNTSDPWKNCHQEADAASASKHFAYLLSVQERKTRDEVIKTIKTGLNQVLAVMAEQLKGGKHGKAAMRQLTVGALRQLCKRMQK